MNEQLTLFAPDVLAKPSVSPDSERDWMIHVVTSPSSFSEFWKNTGLDGLYTRMYLEFFPKTPERLSPSAMGCKRSGMGFRGQYWTLNTSVFRNGASASSLSDILETGDLPQRYFLTKRACLGILRRTEKRGKDLPPMLLRALKAVADGLKEQGKVEDKTR
ncbi:MAG: hypothetical protein ABSH16_00030 [Sedimentisphaerales bacterium]